eukprot:1142473-Pelagomonas_calceolata.AAC.5
MNSALLCKVNGSIVLPAAPRVMRNTALLCKWVDRLIVLPAALRAHEGRSPSMQLSRSRSGGSE